MAAKDVRFGGDARQRMPIRLQPGPSWRSEKPHYYKLRRRDERRRGRGGGVELPSLTACASSTCNSRQIAALRSLGVNNNQASGE